MSTRNISCSTHSLPLFLSPVLRSVSLMYFDDRLALPSALTLAGGLAPPSEEEEGVEVSLDEEGLPGRVEGSDQVVSLKGNMALSFHQTDSTALLLEQVVASTSSVAVKSHQACVAHQECRLVSQVENDAVRRAATCPACASLLRLHRNICDTT